MRGEFTYSATFISREQQVLNLFLDIKFRMSRYYVVMTIKFRYVSPKRLALFSLGIKLQKTITMTGISIFVRPKA